MTVMFDFRVAGIPCTIKADDYTKGSGETRYEVFARGKKPALWLERKITQEEHEAIQERAKELTEEFDFYEE